MELYLIRHAEAVPIEEADGDDDARALTALGVAQAETLGAALGRRRIAFDVAIVSPLVRAQQTGQIVLATAGFAIETRESDHLAPDARPKMLLSDLAEVDAERVACFGHMPHLARLLAYLVGDKSAQVDFEKSGMALVSCPDGPAKGAGVLRWLATPEWYD